MPPDFSDWLVHAGPILFYLVVWGLVFAGTALFLGLFIPFITGDSLLFAAGIIAGTMPGANIWVLGVGVGLAAFAGDQVGFVLGRHYGRPYLTRRRSPFIQRMVERTERFYELFGWWSVVIARYMPWIRVLIPPVAGVSGMRYLRFSTANLVGALGWGVLITVAGYLTSYFPQAKTVTYIVAGVAIALSIGAGIRAVVIDRRERRTAVDGAVAPAPSAVDVQPSPEA